MYNICYASSTLAHTHKLVTFQSPTQLGRWLCFKGSVESSLDSEISPRSNFIFLVEEWEWWLRKCSILLGFLNTILKQIRILSGDRTGSCEPCPEFFLVFIITPWQPQTELWTVLKWTGISPTPSHSANTMTTMN